MAGKALIFQSGGPTHVINASLYGAVSELYLREEKLGLDGIYGGLNGVKGIIDENFVDLTDYPLTKLHAVSKTPASALGMTRYELSEKTPEGIKHKEADIKRCMEVLKAHDIRYVFGIGGNDTAETDQILSKCAKDMSYELFVFHIPKTIDNDLVCTDHCPGYGSAATFVANYLLGTYLDAKSAGKTIDLNVIMGRNAGWIASTAAWCGNKAGYKPLVIIPESLTEVDEFIDTAAKAYKENGGLLQIALSEGARGAKGEWAKQLAAESGMQTRQDITGRDILSDVPLANLIAPKLKKATGARIVSDTLGYGQRAYLGSISGIDSIEAVTAARVAVKFAAGGKSGIMTAIQRLPGTDYSVIYKSVPLSDVARPGEKLIRQVPAEFLDADGQPNGEFSDWLEPLLGEVGGIAYLDASPVKKIYTMG